MWDELSERGQPPQGPHQEGVGDTEAVRGRDTDATTRTRGGEHPAQAGNEDQDRVAMSRIARAQEGEVFGFLGPNGAGKTTTVRMLTCLISKTSGKASIGEYEIGNRADQQKIRRMIGPVSYTHLTLPTTPYV